tara:strand:- start:2996 stop:3721 length:726 start_codon:yes stop_codon:yes gene_type:complete
MYCEICNSKNKYDNCICSENCKTFFELYKDNFSNSKDFKSFGLVKPFTISTITICCKFNSTVDLEKYKEKYEYIANNKFYNCINIKVGVKYQYKQKVCLKIFKNGNIQLCGVENLKSAMYAIRKIFKRLNKIEAFNDDIAYISDIKICMINSDFKINKCIKQSSLCKIIDNKELNNVSFYSYNPTKYPAINIKLDCQGQKTSCMIFRTGSIIITGGIDFKNYIELYKELINLFEKNFTILY